MTEPIRCLRCCRPMVLMDEYKHSAPYERLVTGKVYRCDDCDEDEVVETTWEKVSENRRNFFHG